MQYTKPMIDLVYEIRRRVTADLKPGIKMANPDLLYELAEYFQSTKDTITKALIKELLALAGTDWQRLLEPQPEPVSHPKQVVKVYRGQTQLVAAPADTTSHDLLQSTIGATKPQRIYRGQPIA